jgi:ABC-type uncharacterized transport system permease subunit
MTPVLVSLALLAYFAVAALLIVKLAREEPIDHGERALGLLAVLLHFLVLARSASQAGGLDLHFFSSLSLVGMGVAGVYVIASMSRPIDALGVLVYPIAATMLGLQFLLGGEPAPRPAEWQIQLHVMVALAAYSVLSYAALVAIVLAFQERALRRHRVGRLVIALPPLTLTEAMLFRLIGGGFVLLTLTLLSGVLFVSDLFGQRLAHKTTLSFLAWAVFGVLLWGRMRHGWRGRRAVRFTLAGMAVLLLAFFGSKFVLELVLGRV